MGWRSVVYLMPVLLLGCKGSTNRLGPGAECHSSTECQAGLLCDFGMDPPVCSENFTEPPDAGPDATPEPADADLTPDGTPLPDAPPGTPDAMPTPDAPSTPDAMVPVPDAAVPDAAVPDAAPLPDV